MGKMCVLQCFWTLIFGFEFGRCYAIVLHRQMLLPWQILLPYDIVADVETT